MGGAGGRSPLPEREVSSHFSLSQGGPQARKTNYEWISEFFTLTGFFTRDILIPNEIIRKEF